MQTFPKESSVSEDNPLVFFQKNKTKHGEVLFFELQAQALAKMISGMASQDQLFVIIFGIPDLACTESISLVHFSAGHSCAEI